MKELKMAIAISAIAVVSLATSSTGIAATAANTEQEPVSYQEKVELTMKDLPEAIQEDLKLNHEKDKFVSAYKVSTEEGVVRYKVLLNSGGKELKLWYDAEGNPAE